MKTASELSKLYRTIDLKSLSPTAKETLKKIVKANGNWKRKDEKAQQVFLDFYDKLKDKKPEFIKNTPEYRAKVLEAKKSNVLKARTAKNAKSQNQKQEDEGKGSERDARRPAKSPGWRLKGKHNYKKPTIADIRAKRAYFENRVNRADKKRKKFPMLEKGGYMAKGGKTPFEKLSDKVAKNYQGDKVPKKYQSLYGKTYDKSEAKEVGDKVAAKVYRLQLKNKKMKSGGEILYTEKHRKD
jgi:hypothetical protein